MALSEAVKAMLAKRAAGGRLPGQENPNKPPPVVKPSKGAPPGEKLLELRQREKDIKLKIARATQTEWWFTLVFDNPDAMRRFTDALGLDPEMQDIPGEQFVAALGDRTVNLGTAERLSARDPIKPADIPNPFLQVPEHDNLQDQSDAEMAALFAALTAVDGTKSGPNRLDSPYWIAVYFGHRELKENALKATGLGVFGDKYLDGHKAGRALKIT